MKKKIVSLYTLCAVAIILASALLAQENTISAPKTEIEHFQKLVNIANSVENEISTLAQPSSIRITLDNRDSYDFSAGVRGEITGGDFYLSGLKFWANNSGQRGVIHIGSNIGTIPLYLADIPESGYTHFGVPAETGHTYVSLAQEGEEGSFIVFRVHEISGESVTIDYVYLEQNRITLNYGDSYDFSEGVRGYLQGGDFYFNNSNFYANNVGQRGVNDLGNIGAHSLYLADIPASGYTRFGVPAETGHTYVSLAQEGEEGNFIVFRVHEISGESVTIDYVYLSQNRVTFNKRDSYDFSYNTFGTLGGGDFYLSSGQEFFANNAGQRGVKDLGNIDTMPLYQVNVTAAGYTRFGVAPILGHTYVSLAQEGEEGNFIVFRVLDISSESVTIEYVYQSQNRITFNNRDSYDFSEGTLGSLGGGDFYLSSGLKFYANNLGQRGLLDLGDIGPLLHDRLDIPHTGFTRFGAAAASGHTYISLAQQGEEDNYIVFRVQNIIGESVTIDYVYLSQNRVTLNNNDSYDFSNYTFGRVSGGDFYLSSGHKFYANNSGQRGVQDLGDIGFVPFELVDIPESGYTRFGVSPEAGHTYVSLAQEGEEGYFIVFRVQSISDESVTIDYIYTSDATHVNDLAEDITLTSFVLEQNYPNPFNPTTTIRFEMPRVRKVNISVFNVTGQLVRTLVDAEYVAGVHEIVWDATNDQGLKVQSGIYYYRMTTDEFNETKKLLLLK